jgi:hypothetical protein
MGQSTYYSFLENRRLMLPLPKNDYKHDRGPTVLEDIAEASQGVQERLRRCMEKLAFFGDYPMRQVEDFNGVFPEVLALHGRPSEFPTGGSSLP